MATLLIPTALRGFTDGQAQLTLEGDTVKALLDALSDAFPDITQHLFDENGAIRSYINIFIGDENIKDLSGVDSPVDAAELSIVPAIAGGCTRDNNQLSS